MAIPRDFINELIARIDIVDLIDRKVPLKKAGKNHSACCPFHSEKSPSFTVSRDKQFYHCFGCGAHGNAIDFVMEYDRLEFVDAIEELAGQLGLDVPREQGTGKRPDQGLSRDLYELMEEANLFLESKFVIFEGTGILDNAYKLSGCAGPDVELITRLSDEADFNCSVLWNMITNTTIMGESVSSAVDSAITATINRAKGNGVTLTDIQLANFKEEFYKSLNTTLANKEFVEAIKKSPDYQGRIFNKSCAAQTLQILRSQVGV